MAALALGLSNIAATIGLSGVDARTRWRVGIAFGPFETGMPILGLAIGRSLATTLGTAAHAIGATLLIATGAYGLWQALRGNDEEQEAATAAGQPLGRLLVTDSREHRQPRRRLLPRRLLVSLPIATVVIGAVSVTLSLIGLEPASAPQSPPR